MVNGRGVQSIDVGGRILDALVKAGRPLMLRDLSAMADLAPAQAHAYLISFRRMDLVEQDAETGRYLLGPFALNLGIGRMRSFSPLKLANRSAVKLSLQTGLRTMVGVWGTHGAVAVQVEEGDDDLHIDLRPGKHHSLMKTATGQVFAAFLPRAVVEKPLKLELAEWVGKQYLGDAPSLREAAQRIEQTRSRGFGFTLNDPTPGIASISAPVLDQTGQIQFALTVIGASRRIDVSEASPNVAELLTFTRGLSEELGYLPGLTAPDVLEPAAVVDEAPGGRRGRRAASGEAKPSAVARKSRGKDASRTG